MSQSNSLSIQESFNGALIAAPTAIGLHKLALWVAGDCALVSNSCNDLFVTLSWIVFFFHSVGWRYVSRRVYDRFGLKLDVMTLINRVRYGSSR
jgi:hypothetical protein